MAEAGARERVLDEANDETVGSIGDVANQGEVGSDNPNTTIL